MKDRYQELSQQWIDQAQEDLFWANDSFVSGHYSGVCFLSQQNAEKSLKSFLFFNKIDLIRTHNLLMLLAQCQKLNQSFTQFKKSCEVLNNYYLDTRYPDIGDMSKFDDKDTAWESIELAKQIFEFVKSK